MRICDALPSVLPPCGARTAGYCADAVTDASSVQLSPLSALSVAPSTTAHSLATCEEDGSNFALSPRMLPAAAFGTDRDCGSAHMPAPQPPLQQRARTESLRTIATADASPEPTPWAKPERTASAFQDALAQLMPQGTPAELHACVPRGDQLLNLGRSLPQSLAPVVPYAHGSVVVDGEVVHSEVHEDSAHVWIGRVNMQARVFTAVARALQHSMRSATTCERGVGKSSPAPLSCKPQLQAYTTYLRYTCTCCGLHSFICDDASADAVAAFADNPVAATHDTAAAAHAFLARMMLPSGCPTSAGHSAFTTSAIVDPIGMEASELPVVTLHWFLAEQHAC
ncbi:hypothetical protein EON67_08000 [archaeon]|nr:MAG: hypothetical protein EON67_08000 [archaeon]